MSSYVFMKVLESTAGRYDLGMRLLSGGRIAGVYRRVAELAGAAPGRRVLDLGSGTGGVALACAARGAEVFGIDPNAEMLEVARAKAAAAELAGSATFVELGVAEIEDRWPEESFDAVVSSLCFSELSPDERRYALRTARSRLRVGGVLVVADEVPPASLAGRVAARLARLPLVVVTYVLTQTTTHAVADLPERVAEAGFEQVEVERPGAGLAIVSARKAAA